MSCPGYGDLLFGLSLIDMAQRDYMVSVEAQIVSLIQQQQWAAAFELFDPLLMGDFWPYGSFFNNATGLTDYYNFDSPSYPNNPFESYLNRADVKAALHVDPAYVYSSGNSTVEQYLLSDWMQSIAPWLSVLLESYPVMVYNGQNDIILAAPACEAFLRQLVASKFGGVAGGGASGVDERPGCARGHAASHADTRAHRLDWHQPPNRSAARCAA